MSRNFVRFHEILFQTDTDTKKVLFQKKKFRPLSISKQKALSTDTIFSEGFGQAYNNKNMMQKNGSSAETICSR